MSSAGDIARICLDAIEGTGFGSDETCTSGVLVYDTFYEDNDEAAFIVETEDGYFKIAVSEFAFGDMKDEG